MRKAPPQYLQPPHVHHAPAPSAMQCMAGDNPENAGVHSQKTGSSTMFVLFTKKSVFCVKGHQ